MKNKNLLNAIISKAQEDFKVGGYKNLNLDELSRQIGISKATLYKYVTTKETLYKLCFEMHLKQFGQIVSKLVKEIAASSRELFFEKFFALLHKSTIFLKETSVFFGREEESRFPELSIKLKNFTTKQIEKNFYAILEKGKNLDFFRKDINFQILYHIITQSLLEISNLAKKMANDYSYSTLFYEYFKILFKGILNENGVQYFDERIRYLQVNQTNS